ncbi:hypothetical protein GRB29_09610 [Streptococcus pneumoniae]|nr:hypothetical protein [Streptococcus pneumoniae]
MVRDVSQFMADEPNRESTQEAIYVFCSYDIVESTYFKTIEKNWVELFQLFYDNALTQLQSIGFEFWKYVGDEVLFYKKICKEALQDIHVIPEQLFDVMSNIKKLIHKTFPQTQMFLGLKGTMWIAKVIDSLQIDPTSPTNILIRHRATVNHSSLPLEFVDFLGPDIDLGFRISRYSMRNQLVVSAEFVMLHLLTSSQLDKLSQNSYLSRYRIIKQDKLKGIWHQREYPIILYRPDWNMDNFELFEYDERNYIAESLSINVVNYLRRVFKSLGKEEGIHQNLEIIQSTSSELIPPVLVESPVDIHIAAILFSPDDKVLLMKRGEGKSSSVEKSDFGCTNLKDGESIKTALNRYYKFTSETSVEILTDKSTKKAIPVSIYEYDRRGKIVNGLLFTGRVQQSNLESINFDDYELLKFYAIDELDSLDLILFDDSKSNIEKSLQLIKEQESKS